VGRTFLLLGALAGLLTVALGAFAAHGLRGRLPAASLEWFQTGVHYQGLHALALLAVGLLALLRPLPGLRMAGWAFCGGILLFCGSLYLLALDAPRPLGWVTPFGGVAFLLGWYLLARAAWRLG
jgi:uncharacterized membrane protein YgdD (TMEM256/DUF423 family)